ncbi:S8 family peptidase [Marinobacter salarius]|uniref:Extracellular basic protease n=1 Tax=Marinobacter salarius TaxID=1420917 RepID=A0A1W6KFZ3_9GAMM|nr:S8 family serine peptidase [Marinobacter salarius]ARM86346.1 extracellular basic protease [Marinobacter salarius]
MTIKTLTMNTTIVTALLSASVALQVAPAYAETGSDLKTTEERLNTVRLIIKRESPAGETYYDTKTVPLDNLENEEAELLRDPSVIKVERDMPVFTPRPNVRNVPASSAAQVFDANADFYNDPVFDNLEYFRPGEQYNSRIQEAHQRLSFNNEVTIGIADGGFANRPEINYIAGHSFDYGRGPAFYNADVGCTGDNLYLHGDRAAQISGAVADNGLATAGVAPGANIVAGRVFGCDGFGSLFSVAEAVNWFAGNGPSDVPALSEPVDVINLSLGSTIDCPTYIQDAIDNAIAAGIPVVVATGNESNTQVSAPANCNGVIAVTASTASGAVASFSNTGPKTDTAAQGSGITIQNPDGQTFLIGGTSFATPIVAGMVAATLSDLPDLTPADFDRIVSESGKPLRVNNDNRLVGSGIMDSMLFLDSAGLVRAFIAAQNALAGEREQFAEALSHPAAQTFLEGATGGSSACDIVEFDGDFVDAPDQGDTLRVFSVGNNQPLDPTNAVQVLADTTDSRTVVSLDAINAELGNNRQVGVARCDVATGSNCSVALDTIRGFDLSQVETPASCT